MWIIRDCGGARYGVQARSGWTGHKAGQFAFMTTDSPEGAHPFTIASDWHAAEHRFMFAVKEIGDYTSRLNETLRVSQAVVVEGPYGCFTFEDDRPRQIWVGAGIGITPFIARMEYLARERADAAAANIRLHVVHDARDGRLTGERIRGAVPDWQEASIWFCGPAGFGDALRKDFASHGLPVATRFHRELFAMR